MLSSNSFNNGSYFLNFAKISCASFNVFNCLMKSFLGIAGIPTTIDFSGNDFVTPAFAVIIVSDPISIWSARPA